MAIFLYGFGAFLAFGALMLFGLGSGSGGLLFLIIALAVIGIGAWVQYEQGAPMRERLAEQERRHRDEIYKRQQRLAVEAGSGGKQIDADQWWKDHHRGLWDPNYLPKPAYKAPKIQPSIELNSESKTEDDAQRSWLNSRQKPARQKFGVSHRGAEELTAEWLTYLGEQDVEITQYSNDGGVDVLTKTYCCQVKNYDKKPVGVVDVRALLGTAISRKLKPLLFTNSKLTNDALEFSSQNQIAVIEFNATDATLTGITFEGQKLLDNGFYR